MTYTGLSASTLWRYINRGQLPKVQHGGPRSRVAVRRAIAIGFVPPSHSAPGTRLQVLVRGKPQAAEAVATPFVPHRYVRKANK